MLNELVKDTSTWTKENIEQRTDELVEKAIDIFKL
jgi:hypothetical protein